MEIFHKVIALSKKIATSILRNETPSDLEASDIFDTEDKAYIFSELTDDSKIKARHQLKKQINTRAEWKRLQKEIHFPKRTPALWKYAAAASVVFLISITTYFLTTRDQKTISPAIVDTTIEIGTDKATLTLEDGSEVSLEKGTLYENNTVRSDGSQLVYTSPAAITDVLVYNYLTIPRGGQFFVQLPDGTGVWLNSETRIKYPVQFSEGASREVELVYGEAYFDVSPGHLHKGAAFKVYSQGQYVEVLGTEFNIKAYKDENQIYTTLAEGKVAVNNGVTNHYLIPEQQAILNLSTHRVNIVKVDVYSETSWKKGLFSFKGKTLKEIMRVLSRWYDVTVVFASPDIEEVRFNGVLRKDQPLEEILKTIKNTHFINAYDIQNKTITIE